MMSSETDITICLGSSCFSRGNKETIELIKGYLKEHELGHQVFFHGDLCNGMCEHGPILKIDGQVYKNVTSENIYEILNDFFSEEDIGDQS